MLIESGGEKYVSVESPLPILLYSSVVPISGSNVLTNFFCMGIKLWWVEYDNPWVPSGLYQSELNHAYPSMFPLN